MYRLTLALTLMAAAPAVADTIVRDGPSGMVCNYVEECYETEECTFAKFGMDVDLPKIMPDDATLLLGSGPAKGEAKMVNDVLVVTASDQYGSYMMSNTANGFSKLSAHFAQDLTVVTYHGSCTVTE